MPILGAQGSGAKSVSTAPTIGTATAGDGNASVTFTAPSFSKLPITSYTVTSSSGASNTGASRPVVVTETVAGTRTYTVTATSTAGVSPASSTSNSLVFSVPAAPTIATVTRTNNTTVSIPFTGSSGNASITSYTATSSPSIALSTSGTSTPLTVTGTFVQGTNYSFTVTATNKFGTSSASSASNSLSPFAATVPSAPTIGTVTRTSNTVVSVPYTDGAANGSAITSRTITSSPSISLSYTGASASPIAVTGSFVQGTSYTFSITTTNGVGTSSASSASNALTPFSLPTLSSWSTTTAYPFSNLSSKTSESTGSSMWAGTGQESGINSNPGWVWNGSSWTQRYYPINTQAPSMGRFDANVLIGLGGDGPTAPVANVYTSTSGAAWTAGTALPGTTITGIATKVTGGFYANRGSMSTAGYYCTTAGGAWTVGSAYGGGVSGPVKAADLNLTESYALRGQDAYFYKLTSASGSWAQSVSNPVIANQQHTPFLYNINNSRLLYHPNAFGYGLATYLFNGTTLTASTSLPSGFSDRYWSGGAVGATISALNSEAANTTTHYVATLS